MLSLPSSLFKRVTLQWTVQPQMGVPHLPEQAATRLYPSTPTLMSLPQFPNTCRPFHRYQNLVTKLLIRIVLHQTHWRCPENPSVEWTKLTYQSLLHAAIVVLVPCAFQTPHPLAHLSSNHHRIALFISSPVCTMSCCEIVWLLSSNHYCIALFTSSPVCTMLA